MEITTNNLLSDLMRALSFAADKHRNQRRKDAEASPYINHPIDLVTVLSDEGGIRDRIALLAAALHDTVEDTKTAPEEIEAAFGADVREVVMEVTDDKTLPKAERKRLQVEHAAALSYPARLVKLADKICNLRDMAVRPPALASWDLPRIQEYFDWSKSVIDRLRGTHPVLEQIFDETYARRPTVLVSQKLRQR